jgi:molybdopterin guanine dinucleotide-containing S/N-oxide reductase-like protein
MSKKNDEKLNGWLTRNVGRRQVLQGMGVAGAVVLAGKATAINEILPEFGVEQVLTTADSEGLIQVVVKNGMILRVESLDYPENEASEMGLEWHRRAYAPDRILYPMVREDWKPGGGGDRSTRGVPRYRRVSWDEALDLVAGELQRVKDDFGNEAILAQSIAGWQTAGNLNSKNSQQARFINLFGGSTNLVGNKSYACWQWAAPYSIGQIYPADSMQDSLDNTNTFIFWSSDPMNLLKVRAVGYKRIRDWVVAMKRKGVRIITIDPVFTETAALSDEWVPIRAGGDSALMAAMAYVMISEGLHDQDFIDTYTVGYEPFRAYIMGESDGEPKTPEWAADKTGLPVEKVRALAMEYANTERVKIASARGIQRNDHGEQQVRMLIALATIKGEMGLPGGGLGFEIPGFAGLGDHRVQGRGPGRFPTAPNPVTQTILEQWFAPSILNAPVEMDHDGTTFTYPEPGKSELKLIYWVGGSALNQHDDINMTLRALEKLDTIIVQDSWWTPATRFADIVLPINTLFEREDMTQFWRYVVFQHKIIEPLGESRSDFEVFTALAERLGFKDEFTDGKETPEAWLREMYAASDVPMSYEEFREAGFYKMPVDTTPYVAFSEYRENPAMNPLGTASGKIEIHSETIESYGYDDCPGTPQWIEPSEWHFSEKAADYPLQMMNKHPQWRRHSSYDNVDTLRKLAKINGFEPVMINPADATPRGIATGDVVRVFNDRGQILCAAQVTADIAAESVVVHEGSWYAQAEPGVIGSLDRGGSSSVLTRQHGTSKLAQGPVCHTTLVQVEKYSGEAQPNEYAPIQPV